MIRVMESVGGPYDLANPYVRALAEHLDPDLDVRWFSWRAAIAGDFDVLHLHWPEALIRAESPPRAMLKRALFMVMLTQARFRGRAIVRMVHNRRPHESSGSAEARVMRALDRETTSWVGLNDLYRPAEPFFVVPHGHYRGYYPESRSERDPANGALFFGLIRRYKRVDSLIHAFRDVPSAHSLTIAGKPMEADLAAELSALASSDDRVALRLEEQSDQELSDLITRSSLVILPIRDLFNSGSVLLALSFNRPVLIPDSDGARELRAEFGEQWVHIYQDELTAHAIDEAMRASALWLSSNQHVDMSQRDWTVVGSRMSAILRDAALRSKRRSFNRR